MEKKLSFGKGLTIEEGTTSGIYWIIQDYGNGKDKILMTITELKMLHSNIHELLCPHTNCK